MSRATTVTINLDAIRYNYRFVKTLTKGNKAVAIIKADAYGHGAVMVAKALTAQADAFGVACIEEALELRMAGIKNPILLLEGFFSKDELPVIAEHNFWTAIHSVEQIRDISEAKLGNAINVWLKMDSGMHRLGIAPQDISKTYQKISLLSHVNQIVLMSHFSCSDDLMSKNTEKQIKCFDLHTEHIVAEVSLANSAATLAHKHSHRQWQRPGIMLYGTTPFTHKNPHVEKLQCAMTFTSKIIAIHQLNTGDTVGYSDSYVCKKPMTIATVAAGYGDGYPRHAPNGTPVLVNGKRCHIIGNVSMDMLAIDITHLDNITVGSHIELWGENLPISVVAHYCNTISYTLLTGITRRVHRIYDYS